MALPRPAAHTHPRDDCRYPIAPARPRWSSARRRACSSSSQLIGTEIGRPGRAAPTRAPRSSRQSRCAGSPRRSCPPGCADRSWPRTTAARPAPDAAPGPLKILRGFPAMLPAQRHQHMQALAAAGLEPRVQPDLAQQRAQHPGRLPDALPGHALARVQVEHDAVRLVDGRLHGVPGVEFDGIHLDCRQHRPRRRQLQQGRMPRIQGLRQQTRAGHRGIHVALEKQVPRCPTARTSETGRPFR